MKNNLLTLTQSARSIDPRGAAAIFVVAWLAGFAGSFAVLLIAAALFAGLYAARVATAASLPAVRNSGPMVAEHLAPTPFEQIVAAGLECSKVEFKKPTVSRAKPATV